MTTLELECPGCGQLLELDAGFAGGVCRCSNCGTLMTVPADGEHEAQALRPDRPDVPGQPVAPTSFVTASGESIDMTDKPVVTARPRRRTRVVTTLVLVAVMLAILAAVAWAMWVFVGSQGQSITPEQATRQTLGYDPAVNPFTLAEPNVLGLPLRGSTAVVVDASQASRGWLSAVHVALQHGLTHPGDEAVTLAYTGGDGAAVIGPATTAALSVEQLAAAQENIAPRGGADLADATRLALQSGAEHLVLILSRHVDPDQLTGVATRAGQATIDIIHMNGRDDDLQAFADRAGGRYVPLSDAQLADWLRAAE